MGPLIFTLSLLILVVVWNPFDTNEKSHNLANKMRVLSQKSLKLQQDNEKSFYKAHIEEWKETPFYRFVFDAIKKVAEKGENGVIIDYYFYKPSSPLVESYYSDSITKKGTRAIYINYTYYFSEDENKYLCDYSFEKAFLSGIETYLKKEGFDVIKRYACSLTISW